ncbi:hypothetical protein Tco_0558562, partial [Tanacetum coccineum]
DLNQTRVTSVFNQSWNDMTLINAEVLSNFVSLQCLSSLLNALLQNTMAEQNVPTQPPTRTDEQIVPRSQWLTIGKSNLLFNAQKIQKNPIFQISVDILSNTNFFQAFTASANVPAIYLQQFWNTMKYNEKTGVYSCQVDEQWFDLSADLLRKALAITPVIPAHPFELPPSGNTVIDFVNELGYPEPVEIVSNIRVNYVYQPWRAILTLINQCLTGKTSGSDKPRHPVLQMLWGIVTQTNVDHAELIWEEFTQGIQTFFSHKASHNASLKNPKKKVTPLLIPYGRFSKVIIYYLASNNNIHRRPDSAVHHTGDDFILGNLKFVPKGESVEVFGMAIPDPLITEAIQQSSYYPKYLEMVAENTKKTPQESASVQPATKRATPKKPTTTTPVKQSKPAPPPTKKPSKRKLPQKVRKGKPTFQLVDEDDEAQQESIPQEEDDDPDLELAKKMSLEAHQEKGEAVAKKLLQEKFMLLMQELCLNLNPSPHKEDSLNSMAEQNVPAQPPTRTDEQIVPRSQWLIIGKSNLLFNSQKIQKNPIFQISVDILKNTNFFRAFTASASVPAIYMQQFWNTMKYDEKTGVYSCQVDEQWFDLSADLLRKALAITPVIPAHPFELPPSGNAVIDFVNELGYPEPVEIVSNIRVNYVFQPWSAILTLINQCLTGKTSGSDKPRHPVLQILWGIVTQTNVDHAELLWEEFTQGIQTFFSHKASHKASLKDPKKKVTPLLIPYGRFSKVIIYYLASKNNIHRRPDSAVHHTGDDFILGNLKFVPKGETVEVFGMAIPDPLITEAIQQSSYYPKYLEMVAKNTKKTPQESASEQPATKRAPPRKPTTTTPVKPSKPAPAPTKKPSKHKLPQKVRKGKPTFQLVDEDDEAQQESVPQEEGDDPDLELAKKMILDAHQEKGEGRAPVGGVTIRDPVSETTPKLPEVVGKGKAIVTEEQVAHSLIDLSKKKRTTDQFILVRRDQAPHDSTTGSSSQPEDDTSEKDEGNDSDMEDIDNAHIPKVSTTTWFKLIPESERPATPEPKWTIPPNDFLEPENIWANTYATTYKVPEENQLQRKTYDIGSFIKWFCKRTGKKKLCKADLEGPAFNLVKAFHKNSVFLQYQMDECHKLLTNKDDLSNREGHQIQQNIYDPLPLGGPPGAKNCLIHIQAQSRLLPRLWP